MLKELMVTRFMITVSPSRNKFIQGSKTPVYKNFRRNKLIRKAQDIEKQF